MRLIGTSMTPRHVCAFVCKFTGKERDAEAGNDHFEARYYQNSMDLSRPLSAYL